MQSPRSLVVVMLVLLAVAAAVWQFAGGGEAPVLPTAPTTPTRQEPTAGPVQAGGQDVGAPATGAATAATGERQAVELPGQGVGKAAIVGLVTDPDGKPLAGVTVHAAPGLAFANANGTFDFDNFDFDDLGDNAFDMASMMRKVREQFRDRVTATSGPDGRFRIGAPGSARGVGLRLVQRGFAILDRSVARPTEQDTDVGTLVLQRGAIVSGRVVAANGDPVVGARVSRVHAIEERFAAGLEFDIPEVAEVESLRGESAVTDARGAFELAHLTAGDITLRARHTDHPTGRSAAFTVAAGAEQHNVLITMPRGGSIRGVVTNLPADIATLKVLASKKPKPNPAADPTGMAGAMGFDLGEMLAEMGVAVGERSTTVAADGSFELRGLTLETWRVWLARDSVGFVGDATCSARLEVTPGGQDVELPFEAGVAVTFTAVDAKTQQPVEKLWVRDTLRGGGGMSDMMSFAMPKAAKLTTFPGGVVTVANLRPKAKQKLTLKVESMGYATFERGDIELPKTGSLDLGRVALEPVPTLRVQVLANSDGKPIAGAKVRLGDGGIDRRIARFLPGGGDAGQGPTNVKTGRDGVVMLNRPATGSTTVSIEADGFASFTSAALECTNDGPAAYTARLFVGGIAEVVVVDADGKPVVNATVEHRDPLAGRDTKKTDAQGLARFQHLLPGAHAFRLGRDGATINALLQGRDEDQGAAWTPTDVVDLAVANVRLQKAASASLRGFVRENGIALADARVSFRKGAAGGEDPRAAAEAMFGEMLNQGGGNAGKRNGKTSEQGAYSLSELPEGQHRIVITHKGRAMPMSVPIVLRLGENVVDVELDMTTLRGVVQDPDGKPVDGARIRVKPVPAAGAGGGAEDLGEIAEGMVPGMNLGGGSTIRTDASGAFELRGVDPDVELLVQASAKGYAPASARVTAPRGTAKVMAQLKLAPAGKVRVTVSGDMTFGGVRAVYKGTGDPVPPVVQMLRRGKATLEGLCAGTWEVEASGIGGNRGGNGTGEPRRKTIEVIAGQTVDVEL
jgi:protocatechuate 3,4-dioxygenase beta subunit